MITFKLDFYQQDSRDTGSQDWLTSFWSRCFFFFRSIDPEGWPFYIWTQNTARLSENELRENSPSSYYFTQEMTKANLKVPSAVSLLLEYHQVKRAIFWPYKVYLLTSSMVQKVPTNKKTTSAFGDLELHRGQMYDLDRWQKMDMKWKMEIEFFK